jgi:hypothetical protein
MPDRRQDRVAALFVDARGCYAGLEGVDLWDQKRDARLYAGPWPVVAHPPCERWGRYWHGGPSARVPRVKGDDGGCFAAALKAVRQFGGVIEHPAASYAWKCFGLPIPTRGGAWHRGVCGGWSCHIEQGAYGHKARKATWLYAYGCDLPRLQWGRAPGDFLRLAEGYHSAEERRRAIKTGIVQRLSKKQRAATPPEFRDLLLGIARSARPEAMRTAQ